ncbi:MAG: molecular chaperone TorD family protein [Desulfotalea sp.]
MDKNHIHNARVVYYQLFSALFAFDMTEKDYQIAVQCTSVLAQNPLDDESSKALFYLKKEFAKRGFSGLKDESDMVFYNPLSSLVPMTASYFSEQRDDGLRRVEMIDHLLKSPFRKDVAKYKENEDHIEFICLFMATIIKDEIAGKEYATDLSKQVFTTILNSMANPFIDTLFIHEKAEMYRYVALLARSFFEFERVFHDVEEPVAKNTEDYSKPNIVLLKEKQPAREMPKRNEDEFISV